MTLPFPIPTLLLGAIAAAAVLIYFPYGVVVYGRAQVGMDVAAPRALFDRLPDYAKRATWAHQNSFETFMPFAAAALMAYVTQVSSAWAGWAAIAFVVSRFFFSVCYMLNFPPGRSLMFGIGTFSTATLMLLSLQQASS
jgi:uncharacterized MAPEG superfamily protein